MHAAAATVPSCWDRAVSYGDGVFESVLVIEGIAPLWVFHRLRLQKSIQRLGIHCDIAELEKSFWLQAQQNSSAVIKIILARSGGARGYDARPAQDYTVQVKAYPLPHFSSGRIMEGVRLHVCQQRLSHNPAIAGMKHLNRLEQVIAASERPPGWADEGLMLDITGAVIECTSSNIFMLRENILVTPRLDHCGVDGVMRAVIMESIAADIPLPVQEARLTLAEILAADAVFICNSVFGVWPVCSIGISQIKVQHVITGKIWQRLNAMGYARLYG